MTGPHSARMRWPLTLLLFAAAVSPFLLAVVAQVNGPSAQASIPAKRRPALAFDQYLVDLGEADPVPFVYARFSFTNTGPNSVRVTKLIPSCGCLNPRLSKRFYKPNERGQFYLRVETANEQPGPKHYTVRVQYEDPRPRETELSFRVTLPVRKVTLQPKALIFYRLATGSADPAGVLTREIVVTDHRTEKLTVTAVSCDSPLVTATIDRTESDAHGNRRTHIRVTVSGKAPPGGVRALLKMTTDDSGYRMLRVPLMIDVPRQPAHGHAPSGHRALLIHPAKVIFSKSTNEPTTRTIEITDYRKRPLKILSIKSSLSHVTARFDKREPDDKGHIRLTIVVTFSGDSSAVGQQGRITIRTDDPVYNTLEVPIRIGPDSDRSANRSGSGSGRPMK